MAEAAAIALLSMPLVGVYAIFAVGIVLIYRASKVLNLAHGFMATLPAFLVYTLADTAGLPRIVAVPLGLVAGGALGWAVERGFVRPFRDEGASAQTVGTVVVLGLGIAVMARIWGTGSVPGVPVFPQGFVTIGQATVLYGHIGLFATMLAIFAALTALFRFTDLGLLLRASAENPDAAALMGVNPQRMTALTWFIGGALAAVAGILLAAVTSVHAYTLPLQALGGFLAALIGGLESVPGALLGALVVGLLIGAVPFLPVLSGLTGAAQLLLAVVGLAAMAVRGRTLVGAT